jgi:hypothetical protein
LIDCCIDLTNSLDVYSLNYQFSKMTYLNLFRYVLIMFYFNNRHDIIEIMLQVALNIIKHLFQ